MQQVRLTYLLAKRWSKIYAPLEIPQKSTCASERQKEERVGVANSTCRKSRDNAADL